MKPLKIKDKTIRYDLRGVYGLKDLSLEEKLDYLNIRIRSIEREIIKREFSLNFLKQYRDKLRKFSTKTSDKNKNEELVKNEHLCAVDLLYTLSNKDLQLIINGILDDMKRRDING